MTTRRRVGLGSLLVLGLAALWWLRPSTDLEVPSEGPSPSASLRARTALRSLTAPLLAPEVEDEDEEEEERPSRKHEILVVYLRNAEKGFMLFNGEARMDPSLFWPLEDEAPFPDSETADSLQALLNDPDPAAERDWIALADAEGFSSADIDVDNDPWAAVLGLEVERRAAVREYSDAYEEAWDGQPGQPWTRPHPPIPAQNVLGMPEVDPILDLAEDLIDAHPEHPSADFARLYLLDAMAMSGADDAWSEAVEVLRETDDSLVMTQTAQLLAALPGSELLEKRDLDRLAGVYEDAWDLTESLHLAAFGVEQAMMQDDPRRIRSWLERFERSTGEACDGKNTPRCSMYRDNLDSAVAYLGERKVGDAATWQQAFEIAAWNCARDNRIDVPARGNALWTGGWDWESWSCDGFDCPGAYTACVEARVDIGPVPVGDVGVRLTVVQ